MNGLIISQNEEVYSKFIVEFEEYEILNNTNFSKVETYIKEGKFNVIILDFTKFHNCKTLMEFIKQINTKIPIIAVLNTNQVEYQIEAECLYVDIILKYPIQGIEFQSCIEKLKLLLWYSSWKIKRKARYLLKDE